MTDIVEQLDAEKIKQGFSKICFPEGFPEGPVYILSGNSAKKFERLHQQNAELLKALTDLYEACRWEKMAPEIDAAKLAIAKATEGDE
jgi:hypothetical protein